MATARESPFVGLTSAAAALGIARAFSILTPFVHGHRTSAETVGRAQGAAFLAQILLAPLLGYAAARLGGRRLLVGSLVALVCSSVWLWMWIPPMALVASYAIGALAQVGAACAIVAILEEHGGRHPGAASTGLLAVSAAGVVAGNMITGIGRSSSVALLHWPMTAIVIFVVRATVAERLPSLAVEGDGYRAVRSVVVAPPAWRALATLPVLLSVALALSVGLAAGLAPAPTGIARVLYSAPVALVACAFAAGVVAVAKRWLAIGIGLPLCSVVALGLAAFTPPVGSVLLVASTLIAGALPFALSRGSAPMIAGLLIAGAQLGRWCAALPPVRGRASALGCAAAAATALLLTFALSRSLARSSAQAE